MPDSDARLCVFCPLGDVAERRQVRNSNLNDNKISTALSHSLGGPLLHDSLQVMPFHMLFWSFRGDLVPESFDFSEGMILHAALKTVTVSTLLPRNHKEEAARVIWSH
jgi:hypothetical protein